MGDSNINIEYPKVYDQINYHIIPFIFSDDYDGKIKEFQNNKLWECKNLSNDKLLKHLDKLICSEEYPSTIGRRFILTQKGRKEIGLLNNTKSKYYFSNSKEEFQIVISSIELYLFETNIGFVVINYKYPYDDMKIINNINYYLKKLSYSKFNFKYTIKKSKTEKIEMRKNIKDIIECATDGLNIISYFENNSLGMPDNAIVFSSVVLDKEFEEKEILKHIFRMRRSFKDTYMPSILEYDLDNPEILRTFHNCYWGISLEGFACISHFVDNEKTNSFFQDFIDKVKGSYFYLYMLALHQRYALIHYSILASELPNSIDECIELEKNNCGDKISIFDLKEKLSFLKLRCLFGQVSNITHQAQLYESIREILGVNELIEELDSEIETLSVITELKAEKQKKEEKIRKERQREKEHIEKERFNERLVLIASLIPIISLITLIDPIYDIYGYAQINGLFNFKIIISILIILALIFTFARYFWYKVKMKKIKD